MFNFFWRMFKKIAKFKNAAWREEFRYRVLRRVGRIIMPTYRFQWNQLYWWKDQEFLSFLAHFDEQNGLNSHRRWLLYQLALASTKVPGDTVECGAFRGAGSYLICKATQSDGCRRTHFIFDSFQGLSEPSAVDGSYWAQGNMCCSLENFEKPKANVSIHPGWIPDRFPDVAERRFSFVHIDVDLEQPTADSVAFFYPRLNAGGIMVFDDHGFDSCPGARKAINDFMAAKIEKVIEDPCGSSFILKS